MKKELASCHLVSPEDGKVLSREGYLKSDLHVHSSASHDVLSIASLSPKSLYEKARRRGLDYISFTDHDTMDAYDSVGWEREGLVPGVEIRIRDLRLVGHTLHINVYTLSRSQFNELNKIAKVACDLSLFVQYCREESLPYVYNHPFYFENHDSPNISAILNITPMFPVIEYNMHRVKMKNKLAIMLAERFGKGVMATTDTHTGDVGKAFTLARGAGFGEYFRNVAEGRAYLVPKDLTKDGLAKETKDLLSFISLCGKGGEAIGGKCHSPIDAVVELLGNRVLRGSAELIKMSGALCRAINRLDLPNRLGKSLHDSLAYAAILRCYLGHQNFKARRIGSQLNFML
ncbi:MAG: PHP domain-containing protein [Candidatus Coatesbacteria bacterium]|nr:PHP domain-containing protein [Candidatus Coatesbacteria bacterium]